MANQSLDGLQEMLDAQRSLSTKCGVDALPKQVALKSTLTQLIVEAGEALAPWVTETKPWKKQVIDDATLIYTDEEMIDVLHYAFSWFNLRGADADDVYTMYMAKNSKNHTRVAQKLATLAAAAAASQTAQ